jgi:hypothetical protein
LVQARANPGSGNRRAIRRWFRFFVTFRRPDVYFGMTETGYKTSQSPDAIMKNNLKIIIAIVGAVVLAAAFPVMIWKLTLHTGVDEPAGNGAGRHLAKKQMAFTGYTTPEAALQSIVWTAVKGDCDKAFACLSPETQADINNKPNGRRKFNADIRRIGQQLNGMQITARKILADDNVELKVKLDVTDSSKNGPPMPDFLVVPFIKIDGEWKFNGSTRPYTPDWENGSQPESAAL